MRSLLLFMLVLVLTTAPSVPAKPVVSQYEEVHILRYITEKPEPTPTVVIPEEKISLFPPTYFTDDCLAIADAGDVCISEATQPEDALAMMLYNEGAGIHAQLAVDLLQIIDNLLYTSWTNQWRGVNPDGIPYSEISRDDKMEMMMFWASVPYEIVRNGVVVAEYPGWNGWGVPFPASDLERYPFGQKMYEKIRELVGRWAENGEISIGTIVPALILRNGRSIMYVYSGETQEIPYLEENCMHKYRARVTDELVYNIYYSTFPYIP